MNTKFRDIAGLVATAVILALSFPSAALWPFSYVGLVPLLVVSRNKSLRWNFFGGMAAGFLFYGITFSWFASLTYWVGSIALWGVSLMLVLFSAFWGVVFSGRHYIEKRMPNLLPVFFPALWVVMEYVENHLFTGFGWGSLGYTQWNNLPVAQLASFGSIYAVGFFLVLMNTLIYGAIVNRGRGRLLPTAAAVVLPVAIFGFGTLLMGKPDMSSPLKVGVIQPNFSLDVKWNSEHAGYMLGVQRELTREVAEGGADLVVWPESALYGYLVEEQEKIARITRANNIFLLMGSNHYERTTSAGAEKILYYNSAFLLDPQGRILGRYDKRHLAPFGEYVPMASIIGFIGKVVPAISDFSPGKRLTQFDINGKKFSVLICFENSFPHVVREAAQGVDFLVQITNDGWFGRSAQPYQDLAIAVFRSIENGMTLIRGTNTGISCFIDPWGRISGIVHDEWNEDVFARGVGKEIVTTVAHPTFYKSYGDVFAFMSAIAAFAILAVAYYRQRQRVDIEMASAATAKRE